MNEAVEEIIDLIYPRLCVLCNCESRTGVCVECENRIQLIDADVQRNNIKLVLPKYVEDIFVATIYDEATQRLIEKFKYGLCDFLIDDIAYYINLTLKSVWFCDDVDAVVPVPVPVHISDFADKGFSHGALIAEVVARGLRKPLLKDMLIKRCKTKHLAKLRADERADVLKGAFVVKDSQNVTGKRLLLVDDIITTGATIGECAKTLRKAGCPEVRAYVFSSGQVV